MSAWMVSPAHVTLLLDAYVATNRYGEPMSQDELSELGRGLLAECHRSICHRYPEDAEPRLFEDYVYEFAADEPDLIVALKQVSCYEYQSCEHPGWETSGARGWCQAIRNQIVEALPGMEEAPWGVDDAGPRTRQVAPGFFVVQS